MTRAEYHSRTEFILFSEAQSRYDDAGGMRKPSEIPGDGLCRVIVDCDSPPPSAGPGPRLQTRKERIAFLLFPQYPPTYPQVIGQAAARLCGPTGRLWALGELHRGFAEVLAEASGWETTVVRTAGSHCLVVFRPTPENIYPETVWPFYGGDYGLRLFGFHDSGGDLERRLEQLSAAMRRDGAAAEVDWARIDAECFLRPPRGLGERVTRTVLGTQEDAPPAVLADTLDLWQALLKDCWKRSTLGDLCEDALFCVLPDGPHHQDVSFNSRRLSVGDITASLRGVLKENSLRCRVVENTADEYLLLTGLRRGTSRQAMPFRPENRGENH